MTKLRLISGAEVFTELAPSEVRTYLSKGSMMGSITGFADSLGTEPILVSVQSIEVVFL